MRRSASIRLLLVEDDDILRQTLLQDLGRAGYVVDVATNGVDGEFMGSVEQYAVAVLDLGLPRMTGLEVLKAWRSHGNPLPVLVLTARDTWHERVDGLRAGADDYLGKPFHIEELLARLDVLTRRSHGVASGPLGSERWRLDEQRQSIVFLDGSEELLTQQEYRLLRLLMVNAGRPLRKVDIIDQIFEGERDPDSNIIEVYINRLRRKMGSRHHIQTRRGQGYLFSPDGEAAE